MSENIDLGKYFWRSGQRIELEEEEEFFTAIAENESELEKVKSLPGIVHVKNVQNRIFKVQVSKDQRDKAMERFRSEDVGGVCHHAYRPKGSTNTRYYLTDKIVIKFEPNVPKETIESILSEAGVVLLKEYSGSSNTFLVQVTSAAGKNPLKVANLLSQRSEIEYAEPNLVNRFQKFYTPVDSLFTKQWHLKAWSGAYLVPEADVSATEAWDKERGKRSVVVAVVDDGFDLTHPDFNGPDKVVHPKDYIDGDSNPFPVAGSGGQIGDYHGTPCAGVAIAEENGEGVVGIAPGCAFMPVRFPLSADDDFLTEIFDYIGQYADVISCSWGPPPVNAPLNQLLYDKISELASGGGPRKKGCVIVFAAGNYNSPLNDPDNTSFEWRHPSYGLVETTGPIYNGNAAHPEVIAVSSSTSQNKKAAYSNWGKEISVCAPSNNFHPTNRYLRQPGRGIWTTDNEEFGDDFSGGSRFTGEFGGTSSATPLVAGLAALVISANPDLTAGQVRQILQETADKIEDLDPDPVLGLTKGTYDNSGHSEWFGYGKVNAAQAVEEATRISDLIIEVNKMGSLPGKDEVKIFKLHLGDKLTVSLEGPEHEDFDLYLKKDSIPTTTDYDEIGYSSTSNEKVMIQSAQPGDYYIMVHSFRGSGDFNLKVRLE